MIEEIGIRLEEKGSEYYTCHCTGLEPYEFLKKVMKDNIKYLATGSVVEI
jgi:7,8-dihydropterin-6-yl-methyl-4-(beta-D-ribofuranosyl)aminobenzene 5'-phosphate synthase